MKTPVATGVMVGAGFALAAELAWVGGLPDLEIVDGQVSIPESRMQ